MNKKRLLQLAQHLESGKLGHKEFKFSVYNEIVQIRGEKFSANGCGTMGCALGECPIIFEEWEFSPPTKQPQIGGWHTPFSSAMEFFEISRYEAFGLFIPREPRPWNKKILPASATKEDVAQNIREFIKWKEGSEKP